MVLCRMRLALQPSNVLNWMRHWVVVLFNTAKYKVMKQRSFFLILSHVYYLKREELPQASNILRRRSTRLVCMSVKESMSFM